MKILGRITLYSLALLAGGNLINGVRAGEPAKNCVIYVTTIYKSGEEKSESIAIHQPSRSACTRAGKLHENNFAPEQIEKKTVSVKWQGG